MEAQGEYLGNLQANLPGVPFPAEQTLPLLPIPLNKQKNKQTN